MRKGGMTTSRLFPIVIAALSLSCASASGFMFRSTPTIVHFDLGSSAIDDRGRRVLDYVIDIERQYPESVWRLSAYTDRVGSAAYNRLLACRRGEAVRDYLIRRGVPPEDLSIAAFGEIRFAVETADEIANQWNRRVEVTLESPEYRLPQTRDEQGRPTCR